jgi:Raf kinase inhibitor-like YbhB/YbcL family protein
MKRVFMTTALCAAAGAALGQQGDGARFAEVYVADIEPDGRLGEPRAFATDGALPMAGDANGVIYRIAYTGAGAHKGSSTAAPVPAGPMPAQAAQGSGVPIAIVRPETQARGTLTVSSASFARGALMNERYSEYADGVSPALSWTAVPNAKSYAIIAEDPDARPITPVVHWLAWNIPAAVTSLPEGIQEQPRLTDPDGVLQGRTTHGSVGYYGPHPPVGDPPHHYHFQVYALDSKPAVPSGADRDQLLAAMKGHILAKGELVGRYGQRQKPQK